LITGFSTVLCPQALWCSAAAAVSVKGAEKPQFLL